MILHLSCSADDQAGQIVLTMKPNICVLSEAESQCRDLLVAEWQAKNNKTYSLCLYQSTNNTPIECWENVSNGKAEFMQSIGKTTLFELRESNSRNLLGQQAYRVINADKKYQRSRRNPWSFF